MTSFIKKKHYYQPSFYFQVTIDINFNDLAYYDKATKDWMVEPGHYKLQAGSSSKDIRGVANIAVN